MSISLDRIEDKIECLEATSMKELELKMNQLIEINKALLLHVYSVQHTVYVNPRTERPNYSAVVHFKAK